MAHQKVWLLTGTSSGFGLSLTKRILERGDIAVATLRKPEVLSDLAAQYPDRLLTLKVDVTKRQDVIDAFAQAQKRFGRIDVVFNNAGYATMAEVEAAPEEIARDVFEVDFWGAVYVTQEAVRFLRDVNKPGEGGRLIQNSSALGVWTAPTWGFYAAAKHALEAVSESLWKELDPAWNIKVTILEPGRFRTEGQNSFVKIPLPPAYSAPHLPSVAFREGPRPPVTGDPDKAADIIYKLVELPDPPLRLALGKDSVEPIRGKIALLTRDLEKYASWSDGVSVD